MLQLCCYVPFSVQKYYLTDVNWFKAKNNNEEAVLGNNSSADNKGMCDILLYSRKYKYNPHNL